MIMDDGDGFGFSFAFKVREWDDYKCQAQTKHGGLPPGITYQGQYIDLFHRVIVKILDLPANEEAKQKRLDSLNRIPTYGPPAIVFLNQQNDGWYLNLPYPEEANVDSLIEETAVILRWFCRGLGVSVEFA